MGHKERIGHHFYEVMRDEKSPEPEIAGEKLLARITLSRHEETAYTGVGRDITEQGISRAREKGRKIHAEKGMPSLIGSSPKERAIGTGQSIEEGLHEADDIKPTIRWLKVPGLQSTKYRDPAFLAELSKEWGSSQEVWTRAHYHEPKYYDNPGKIETNEEKRARMYRELERLVRFLEKREPSGEVPHLVFISHYELLTLLLDDVFGIDTFDTPNTPTFGEHIDIDAYHADKNGNIPVKIQFRERGKKVLFDRTLRRFVSLPA